MIASKLIFTLLLSWLVAHISAHPKSAFAEWGEKVLGSVGRLWFMIAHDFRNSDLCIGCILDLD